MIKNILIFLTSYGLAYADLPLPTFIESQPNYRLSDYNEDFFIIQPSEQVYAEIDDIVIPISNINTQHANQFSFNTAIVQYLGKNHVWAGLLLQSNEQHQLHIILEYSESDSISGARVYFNGNPSCYIEIENPVGRWIPFQIAIDGNQLSVTVEESRMECVIREVEQLVIENAAFAASAQYAWTTNPHVAFSKLSTNGSFTTDLPSLAPYYFHELREFINYCDPRTTPSEEIAQQISNLNYYVEEIQDEDIDIAYFLISLAFHRGIDVSEKINSIKYLHQYRYVYLNGVLESLSSQNFASAIDYIEMYNLFYPNNSIKDDLNLIQINARIELLLPDERADAGQIISEIDSLLSSGAFDNLQISRLVHAKITVLSRTGQYRESIDLIDSYFSFYSHEALDIAVYETKLDVLCYQRRFEEVISTINSFEKKISGRDTLDKLYTAIAYSELGDYDRSNAELNELNAESFLSRKNFWLIRNAAQSGDMKSLALLNEQLLDLEDDYYTKEAKLRYGNWRVDMLRRKMDEN